MSGEDRPAAPPVVSGPEAAQDDPFGALRPGTQIGKYEMVEVLGQGGFGITYRARDTQLRRDVAVKEYLPTSFAIRHGGTTVLPRSTHVAEDFRWGRERFLDEARTLATLEDAPGIVNVYDFMEANGTAYMVMALVRGETVEARLKRDRRLPQPAIEQLLYPLLDGLEKVHEAGFLHRDIKPANILLDGSGRPTLVDFGASRVALQGRTQLLTAVYTPGYAAFEQSTSAHQGPWTDIYALAATLYHCVTGAPPPAASDRMMDDRIVPAVEAGKGRYAPSLLAAIDAGLRLKAAGRPQSVADWRLVLSGIGGGRAADGDAAATRQRDDATRRMTAPMTRAAATAPGGAVAGAKRVPVIWIAAGFVALALAGGGAWLALRPAPETPVEALRRVEAEAQRQAALAARLREEEAARQRAAAEARRKADEEVARRAAEEKAAAEAAARRQTEAAERARAAAAEARRQAEADAARKAAEEKAAADATARRKAEEDAAARAAADASRRRAEEQARAEAEIRRKADEEASRKAAEEKAAADAVSRRKTEEEAASRAAAEAATRRKAEADAAAETARRRAEEQARAEAAAGRQAEEESRRAAEAAAAEKARAEIAARDKAAAEATAAAEAAAMRQAEEAARRAAEDKARSEADTRRQAEVGETALRLSEADRKRVQVALTALGHNTQGSDGAFGPRTRQMIAAWQKSQAAADTGYLTAVQLAALRQQAAPALARFDEEQKKIEDDKRKAEDEARRKPEDDARKRAEEDRRPQQQSPAAQPSVAAAPSTTSPSATPGAAAFDGAYPGEHCSAPRNMPIGCGPVELVIQAGIGTYNWRVGRCKKIATMSFKVDPSGSLAGTWSGFNEVCEPSAARVWGRVTGNRVAIESGGNLRANFTRK